MRLLSKKLLLNIKGSTAKKWSLIATLSILIFTISAPQVQAFTVIEDIVWGLVNNVFGRLLGLSGMILDSGIEFFVIGFGQSFLSSGVGQAVDTLWESVRDIFNLTFIFALVYIGFKIILNSDDSNTRRWLVHLILAALLVNFSLFITKFVVDVSNITATQIVNSGFAETTDPQTGKKGPNVSKTFMNSLGIQSAFGGLPETMKDRGKSSAWGYIFGSAILFIVASFVFAVGGILLIIRYAVLCLYMILSPFMFIGWVFPQMESYSKRYWSGFLGRAFFAPAYLLLIYFAAVIINAFYGNSSAQFGKVFGGDGNEIIANFENTIPPFIVAIIFLLSAVVIAKKMGAQGADAALKMGTNMRRKMQRGVGSATFGTAAWAGRRGVGSLAQRATENETFKNYASRHSLIGKGAFKASQVVASSSFDARNVGNIGNSLGIGTGQKGGYSKTIKDNNTAKEKFAKDTEADIDMNDPVVRAKISARSREIKAESELKKGEYSEVAEQLRDNKNVSVGDIKNQVITQKKKISDAKLAYKQDVASSTKTTSQLASLKDKITKYEADLNTKNVILSHASGKSDIQSEIETLQKEAATPNISNKDKIKAQQEIENKNKELLTYDTQYETLQEATQIRISDLESKAKDALKYATSETKYANVIAQMDELEKSEQFWNRAGNKLSGGLIGSSTGLAVGAGTLGVTAGLVAGVASVQSQGHLASSARKNLEKNYGRDGVKMTNTEKKRSEFKIIANEIKRMEGGSKNKEEAVNITEGE